MKNLQLTNSLSGDAEIISGDSHPYPKPGILLTPSPTVPTQVKIPSRAQPLFLINKCMLLGKWYNGLTF